MVGVRLATDFVSDGLLGLRGLGGIEFEAFFQFFDFSQPIGCAARALIFLTLEKGSET